MTAHAIASKFRRALRNGTGASFSQDQLQELARYGVLRTLAQIEADELCPETPPRIRLCLAHSVAVVI